jgi:hypothetical protein
MQVSCKQCTRICKRNHACMYSMYQVYTMYCTRTVTKRYRVCNVPRPEDSCIHCTRTGTSRYRIYTLPYKEVSCIQCTRTGTRYHLNELSGLVQGISYTQFIRTITRFSSVLSNSAHAWTVNNKGTDTRYRYKTGWAYRIPQEKKKTHQRLFLVLPVTCTLVCRI